MATRGPGRSQRLNHSRHSHPRCLSEDPVLLHSSPPALHPSSSALDLLAHGICWPSQPPILNTRPSRADSAHLFPTRIQPFPGGNLKWALVGVFASWSVAKAWGPTPAGCPAPSAFPSCLGQGRSGPWSSGLSEGKCRAVGAGLGKAGAVAPGQKEPLRETGDGGSQEQELNRDEPWSSFSPS